MIIFAAHKGTYYFIYICHFTCQICKNLHIFSITRPGVEISELLENARLLSKDGFGKYRRNPVFLRRKEQTIVFCIFTKIPMKSRFLNKKM